jgi:hypothetical protein
MTTSAAVGKAARQRGLTWWRPGVLDGDEALDEPPVFSRDRPASTDDLGHGRMWKIA